MYFSVASYIHISTIKHIFLVQFLRGIQQNFRNFCVRVCNLLIVVNVGGGFIGATESVVFSIPLFYYFFYQFCTRGGKNLSALLLNSTPPPPSSPYLPLWFPPLVGLFPFSVWQINFFVLRYWVICSLLFSIQSYLLK